MCGSYLDIRTRYAVLNRASYKQIQDELLHTAELCYLHAAALCWNRAKRQRVQDRCITCTASSRVKSTPARLPQSSISANGSS